MLVPQDPSDQEALKSWLVSTLIPLCQADPEALAKYVMALIKKDKQEDELKTVCFDQLKVFLEDNTKPFVDEFFRALKTRNYITPKRSSSSSSRRSKEKYSGRRTSKRSSSRSPVGHRSKRPNDRERSEGVSSSRHQPKPKARCRDFDEKGVCILGDTCLFDHGPDPVVLDAAAGPLFKVPVTPDVNHSNASSSPNPRPNLNFIKTEEKTMSESVVSQNTTVTPAVVSAVIPTPSAVIAVTTSTTPATVAAAAAATTTLPSIAPTSALAPVSAPIHEVPVNAHSRRGRGAFSRGMRGGGRFGRGRIMQTDPSEKCTLEVRKLPQQLNTISTLNEFFSKFGTIVNLQVRYQGDPEAAVVQFATHGEAVAAHRCPDAVLGNRFIKLFWHNKEQEKLDPTPEKPVVDDIGGENHTNQSTDSTDVKVEDNSIDNNTVDVNNSTGPRGVLSQPNLITIPARKQLTKSNVAPTSSSSNHGPADVPMTKTPSEQKKEKLLQKNEIKKKCQEILAAVRKDQAAVAEKMMNCNKDERSSLKELFNILDAKRKKLEEDLVKVSEELLKECKATGKRGRERPTGKTLTGPLPAVTSPSKKVEKDSN